MKPLVSIILPTYNGQKYLSQSIESCLNQTYQNIELIIVDDASNDESPEIIKRYSMLDPRVKVITNQKNKKLPKSLNIGHKTSSGEFITWTSDDNYYHLHAIDEMVGKLITESSVGMVYCDFEIVDHEQKTKRLGIIKDQDRLAEGNCIGPCFLYRQTVSNSIGEYSSAVIFAEDYDYWLRIATRFPMSTIHKSLYFYREHDQSLTSLVKSKKIQRAKELAIARSLGKLPWLTNQEKLEKGIAHMYQAISKRDLGNFVRFFFVAFRFSPRLTLISTFTKVSNKFFHQQ